MTVTAWHTAILRINYVRHSTLVGLAPRLRVVNDKTSSTGTRSSLRAKS